MTAHSAPISQPLISELGVANGIPGVPGYQFIEIQGPANTPFYVELEVDLTHEEWSADYGSSNVESDLNGDGIVNAVDYTIWRDAEGKWPLTGIHDPDEHTAAVVPTVPSFGIMSLRDRTTNELLQSLNMSLLRQGAIAYLVDTNKWVVTDDLARATIGKPNPGHPSVPVPEVGAIALFCAMCAYVTLARPSRV